MAGIAISSAKVFAVLLVAAAASAAESGAAVTPIEKVITLIEDLKAEVEADGQTEAQTYGEFACFCKDTTEKKSSSVIQGQDEIESLSAEIAAKTAEVETTAAEVEERKKNGEALAAKLVDTKAQYAKAEAIYEERAADLSKAISALERAIKVLEESKPSLLQTKALHRDVQKGLALADALGLIDVKKNQAVSAFLQVDPNDPEYKFHSQGIIDILEKLLGEFRDEKSRVDAEWEKAEKSFKELIADLEAEIADNEAAIVAALEKIARLKTEIAEARESLVNAEAILKDDKLYLHDLTKRCEDRSKEWDQRTQMRAEELEALGKALEILTGSVQPLDEEVNKRALLLAKTQRAGKGKVAEDMEALSFLQVDTPQARSRVLLQVRHAQSASALQQALKGQAVELLSSEAARLHSSVLARLASRAAGDPFTKIKQLIQQLIERLLAESAAEATKKGFCDTELGKAETDRMHRYEEVKKLNQEIAALEAKEAELGEEIEMLTDNINETSAALDQATGIRGDEKTANLEDIAQAKEGLEAVKEAIAVLKAFYKKAGKATVLLQASPVDFDTEGPGFDSAYTGKQKQSEGIIGILEVIASDFERTIRKTEEAEAKAHADFVLFDRSSKADVGGSGTKKELNEQDLVETRASLEKKFADLKSQMDLLDDALKVTEELKPTCIDTGMSYEERVAKREEEIEALKKALCILDSEGVEPDCA